VRALSSERDANFRVDTSAGPYLLKITNAAEDPQVTDLHSAALRHLERESPSLPVPRLVAARGGTDQPREMLGGRGPGSGLFSKLGHASRHEAHD
jgi:Ser/Thr protein kinase RdoA (MazF antagonist)